MAAQVLSLHHADCNGLIREGGKKKKKNIPVVQQQLTGKSFHKFKSATTSLSGQLYEPAQLQTFYYVLCSFLCTEEEKKKLDAHILQSSESLKAFRKLGRAAGVGIARLLFRMQ